MFYAFMMINMNIIMNIILNSFINNLLNNFKMNIDFFLSHIIYMNIMVNMNTFSKFTNFIS